MHSFQQVNSVCFNFRNALNNFVEEQKNIARWEMCPTTRKIRLVLFLSQNIAISLSLSLALNFLIACFSTSPIQGFATCYSYWNYSGHHRLSPGQPHFLDRAVLRWDCRCRGSGFGTWAITYTCMQHCEVLSACASQYKVVYTHGWVLTQDCVCVQYTILWCWLHSRKLFTSSFYSFCAVNFSRLSVLQSFSLSLFINSLHLYCTGLWKQDCGEGGNGRCLCSGVSLSV